MERTTMIPPQRQDLLLALPEIRKAAFAAGALGCSLSGSGPSYSPGLGMNADVVETAMSWALMEASLTGRAYRAPLEFVGAQRVPSLEPVG